MLIEKFSAVNYQNFAKESNISFDNYYWMFKRFKINFHVFCLRLKFDGISDVGK